MIQQRKDQWELGRLTERCDDLGDRIKALECDRDARLEHIRALDALLAVKECALTQRDAALKLSGEALRECRNALRAGDGDEQGLASGSADTAIAAIKACGVGL